MKIKHLIYLSTLLFSLTVQTDKRIYSTDDSIGNRQYNKPSYTITDNGRIYETDSIGNKRYDKQSYRIEGNKILPMDSIGNRQYDKPAFEIK